MGCRPRQGSLTALRQGRTASQARGARVGREDTVRRAADAGEAAEARERQKLRPDLARREPGQLHRLANAPVRECEVVVQEVPILPRGETDVGPHHQEPAAWAQHPSHRAQRRHQVGLRRQVLQNVAGKGDVGGGRGHAFQRANVAGDHLHAWRRALPGLRVGVYRDPPRRPDVVDELAVAGAQIHHSGVFRHITLEEPAAEDAPDGGVAPARVLIEAHLIEAGALLAIQECLRSPPVSTALRGPPPAFYHTMRPKEPPCAGVRDKESRTVACVFPPARARLCLRAIRVGLLHTRATGRRISLPGKWSGLLGQLLASRSADARPILLDRQ